MARVRAGLQALGVTMGDRVAAYLPNSPEALIAMLATASLGAIWTSCSPDFGAHSVVDRFAQTAPRVLLAVDGYAYGGKKFDRRPEVAAIAAQLPSLEAVIVVDYLGTGAGWTAGPSRSPAGPTWRGRQAQPNPSSPRCRSRIRSGCSTPPAPPACPSRSCTATAASCLSTSRRSACTRT